MLSKRKVSKGIKISFSCYVIICLISLFSSSLVFAEPQPFSNWHDIAFEYTNNTSWDEVTDLHTSVEPKEDDSSAYAYNDTSNTDIDRVFVYGSNSRNDIGRDLTYGPYKNLPIGQAYYFPNYVNERGYDHASLHLWPSWGTSGMRVHLWWSPDSI